MRRNSPPDVTAWNVVTPLPTPPVTPTQRLTGVASRQPIAPIEVTKVMDAMEEVAAADVAVRPGSRRLLKGGSGASSSSGGTFGGSTAGGTC